MRYVGPLAGKVVQLVRVVGGEGGDKLQIGQFATVKGLIESPFSAIVFAAGDCCPLVVVWSSHSHSESAPDCFPGLPPGVAQGAAASMSSASVNPAVP